MPTLIERPITTISEFVQFVDRETSDSDNPCWFRGVGKSSYKLLPSLYRHPTKTSSAELLELEEQIIVRFKERSVPYLASGLKEDWEYLFLMQHFGVPTRLLDWTENPFMGLFFALTSARIDTTTSEYVDDASVWVLSPGKWNKRVFEHISFRGTAASHNDRFITAYGPKPANPDPPPANPAAIMGIHNSPRIVAQRGVFTIFGSNIKPMEDIFQADPFQDGALSKLVIPKANIGSLLEKMFCMGFTDAVAFPDLEGLARETKRYFGFGV